MLIWLNWQSAAFVMLRFGVRLPVSAPKNSSIPQKIGELFFVFAY